MIEAEKGASRLKPLLRAVSVAPSSWYHSPTPEPRRPGPAPKPLDEGLKAAVVAFAGKYPRSARSSCMRCSRPRA
jgi:hypothetical protein